MCKGHHSTKFHNKKYFNGVQGTPTDILGTFVYLSTSHDEPSCWRNEYETSYSRPRAVYFFRVAWRNLIFYVVYGILILERRTAMLKNGLATAIFVFSPPFVVQVIDETKDDPRWKLPGGTGKPGDEESAPCARRELTDTEKDLLDLYGIDEDVYFSSIACAQRELQEETHIFLEYNELTLLQIEDRGTHWFFLFGATIENARERGFDEKKRGNEGEVVALFDQRNPRENVESAVDFFDPHRKMLMLETTLERITAML